MKTEICWLASMSASCFYTARELVHGRPVDPQLADILAEPVRHLADEIEYAGFPADRFWRQLVTLSAQIDGNRRLAEVAIAKTVRLDDHARRAIAPLALRFSEIESTMLHQVPQMMDALAKWSAPVRGEWNVLGNGILKCVAQMTDERLIAPGSNVALVYPTPDGGGVVNLAGNSICLEAVPGNPLPQLPEAVRLAWFVAQLNVDLPIYSETLPRERIPLLAAAAMLPPVLRAAEELGLARYDRASVLAALGSVPLEVAQPEVTADVLLDWWETYDVSRPTFRVALAALEQMLTEMLDQADCPEPSLES